MPIAVKKYIPARMAISFQLTRRCQSSQIAKTVPMSGATTPITEIVCLSRLFIIILSTAYYCHRTQPSKRPRRSALAARFLPGIPNRILELVPGGGVAFFPAWAGIPLDVRPISAAVALVGAQVVAIAVDRAIVFIGTAAPCGIHLMVLAEVSLER